MLNLVFRIPLVNFGASRCTPHRITPPLHLSAPCTQLHPRWVHPPRNLSLCALRCTLHLTTPSVHLQVHSAPHYTSVALWCTLHPTAPSVHPQRNLTFATLRCTLHLTTPPVHLQVHSASPYTSVAPRCTSHATAPPKRPQLNLTFGARRCKGGATVLKVGGQFRGRKKIVWPLTLFVRGGYTRSYYNCCNIIDITTLISYWI